MCSSSGVSVLSDVPGMWRVQIACVAFFWKCPNRAPPRSNERRSAYGMDSADWPRSYHRGGAVKPQVTVEHCPPGRIQLGDRVQLTHNEMHAVSALVSDPASPGVI